mmetsp:Transcript_49787/g.130995  ORF Transcript_49787/g.130995 Transcript_49787/m.130995 type:complete len:431 (+) Transcript_49787:34-1326(+)
MAFFLTGAARHTMSFRARNVALDEYERKMPEEKHRVLDMEVGLLLNRTWQPRRFIMTRDALHFAFSQDEVEIDHIPLAEIASSGIMKDCDNAAGGKNGRRQSTAGRRNSAAAIPSIGLHIIHIATEIGGYNSGRAYYLQAESNEMTDRLLLEIQENSKAARDRMASRNILRRAQRRLKAIFDSIPAQVLIIGVIFANFAVTIVDSQMMYQIDHNNSEVGNGTLTNQLDLFFVSFFLSELVLNVCANWYTPFISNRWNFFDSFIIVASFILALVPGQSPELRTGLQAIRVLRVLGKIPMLRKVISALAVALLPVLSVFFILILLVSIGAVLAVSMFGSEYQDQFAMFDLAFVTLFFVTAGEPWPESVRELTEDGRVHWPMMTFCFVYTVATYWIFLQVCFTVLLDNFIAASTTMAINQKLSDAQVLCETKG